MLDGGTLFESTGLVGQSSLREVELATGRVIRKIDVPPPIFAEGLALVGDQPDSAHVAERQGARLRPADVCAQGEFTYRGEGWGLCHDGSELVMSDGSANLTIRRADRLRRRPHGRASRMDGQPRRRS